MLFDKDQSTWTMTKAELCAVLEFTSHDETRPSLNAVGFSPSTGEISATDGSTALAVLPNGWRPRDNAPIALPRTALQSIAKASSRSDRISIGVSSNGTASAHWGALTTTISTNKLRFPAIPQVWPESYKALTRPWATNATLLARLATITKATSASRFHAIEVYGASDPDSPMLFVHVADMIWAVLIMQLKFEPTVETVTE